MSLWIVGFGPGNKEGMTKEAWDTLAACDCIVGYTAYVELLKPCFPEKEFYQTPMRQEKERCQFAISEAAKGRKVSVVCSGDSGVYGMAGLIYQLLEGKEEPDVHVVSGVTAASSGAARLGAPLGHDFSVISLSDLLTPVELIKKRLQAAAEADMVICLYNPASHNRSGYLKMACEIVKKYRGADTVCGYVHGIGRSHEEIKVLTLQELEEASVDMQTTVYIGNSATRMINGKMVTPRGYVNV